MQLTVIWPDGSKTFERNDHMRGLSRRDHRGQFMRPAFIIAVDRPPPNVEQSAVAMSKLRRDLALLGAFVPIGSQLSAALNDGPLYRVQS